VIPAATSRPATAPPVLVPLLAVGALVGCGDPDAPLPAAGPDQVSMERPAVLDLWEEGAPAFGVFVPDERPAEERGEGAQRLPALYTPEGGERLARNPLYDYLFLNLEGHYDGDAVVAMVEGIRRSGVERPPALLVRIPPLSEDGEEWARQRVHEVLESGADGVVLPHIRTLEEARVAVGFFQEAGADVWSPGNREGRTIAMLMLEDPEAVARAGQFAQVPGYSVLACGIGSLTSAMGGDREGAEAWNLHVLEQATAAGLPDMITANAGNVEERLEQGFLALLMAGPDGDEVIRAGRALAGRE
jgi:2-keto-3-deoxy-L-rhamnonate aldolase RhmA